MALRWFLHDQKKTDWDHQRLLTIQGRPLKDSHLEDELLERRASRLLLRVPWNNFPKSDDPSSEYLVEVTRFQARILDRVAQQLYLQTLSKRGVENYDPLFLFLREDELVPTLSTPFAPIVKVPSLRQDEVERLRESGLIYSPNGDDERIIYDGWAYDRSTFIGAWRSPLRRLFSGKPEYSLIEVEKDK